MRCPCCDRVIATYDALTFTVNGPKANTNHTYVKAEGSLEPLALPERIWFGCDCGFIRPMPMHSLAALVAPLLDALPGAVPSIVL